MYCLTSTCPKLNGLDAIKFIKQSYRQVKLIMLSTYNEDHIVEKAKQLGANGYLLKNSNKNELLQTIQLVMNNQTSFPYRPPAVDSGFDKENSFLKQFNITKREKEILTLIKNGFTNSEMAGHLVLSIYTIETHRKNIMQKLGLKTPAALMKWILENNILEE